MMTTLKEIETHYTECYLDGDAGLASWAEAYGNMLIRALRQLGRDHAAVEEYLEARDVTKIAIYNNMDNATLELFGD